MNVTAIVPLYVPHSRVGAWITTHEYLAELVRRGHQVDAVTSSGTAERYVHEGVTVWPNGSDIPRGDLLLSHLGDHPEVAAMGGRLGIPSVQMVHGFHDQNLARLEQYPPRLAIFASEALRADVGWDGPSIVAHPPVRQADYRVRSGKAVTLINLSALKGGLLIAWIAEAFPDQQFLGVRGWGHQFEWQPPNIEIIDAEEDVRRIYRRTRILLMPSERESYGRCAVEAACSGIPTIAHPSPGLVEAMGDAATWVDRADRAGWIAAVAELLEPDAWRAASRRARRAIQADPDATVATVADAIEAIP